MLTSREFWCFFSLKLVHYGWILYIVNLKYLTLLVDIIEIRDMLGFFPFPRYHELTTCSYQSYYKLSKNNFRYIVQVICVLFQRWFFWLINWEETRSFCSRHLRGLVFNNGFDVAMVLLSAHIELKSASLSYVIAFSITSMSKAAPVAQR